MQTITREIPGAADFELGRPRPAPLAYTADFPDGTATGLAFLIPGFGGDADQAYAAALRRHVVRDHGMAAVSVRYHCFGSRPETGASIAIDSNDHLMLLGLAALHDVRPEDPTNIRQVIGALKAAGVTAEAFGTLTPARGEYQNFGVLQAMDHLAVLGDLLRDGPAFDRSRIVALGSSHGGYIAHMLAKLAPRTLAMVIDNSSYTRPPLSYLGLTTGGEWYGDVGGVMLHCRNRDGWSLEDREAPEFYSPDRDVIRDLAFRPHLETSRRAAGETATQFRMVNAATDSISPPVAKQRQVDLLRDIGFDAKLLIVEEDQLDGRLFKSMNHGMDASLASLFDLGMDDLEPRDGPIDLEAETALAFEGLHLTYRFGHGQRAPYITGACGDRFA